ncbi:MG2 domain-containing protein [Pontimicrobium sp. IMCC45349]|uniref:alpha-2-macroglobulin family protein n=1 Tax=Pontimicrobium sp. IMCC45349 TaxID=3391574 RepID=UPI0039A07F58
MKNYIAILMIVLFSNLSHAQNDSFNKLWKDVTDFENEGLPKSALKVVEDIAALAQKEYNNNQIIKSLIYKSKYALTLEEDAQLKVISDFKTQIKNSEFPTTNILENLLANLYWQYFDNNRYRFYNRTKTEAIVDETDFRTWDLQTLFNEIHKHYQNSLQNGLLLQLEDLKHYDTLLITAADSKKYRPTLFDFLAHNALKFYKTSENSITNPSYKFEIDNANYIGDATTFSTLNITSKDTTSLQLNALKIYQDLIQFHLKYRTPYALTEVNLERLKFVKQHATFNNKETLYLETLEKEKNKLTNHETSGLYTFEIATLHYQKGNTYNAITNTQHRWKTKEALNLCKATMFTFPDSRAAKKCQDLQQTILRNSLNIKAENYVPLNLNAKVLVNYKNLNNLEFIIYHISEKQINRLYQLYDNDDKLKYIKKLKVYTKWNQSLRNEEDYQQHSTEVIIPKLDNGQYLIVAQKDNFKTYAFSSIQSTDYALIEKKSDDIITYQVINRNNGAPITNASINLSYQKNYKDNYKSVKKTTDANGEFVFHKKSDRWTNIKVVVSKNNQKANFGGYYIDKLRKKQEEEKTKLHGFIFTDRSIYRPGQTVYYKGIIMKTEDNVSSVIANEPTIAILYDANRQEVARHEAVTNEFGSVTAEFILPKNGITGGYRMTFHGQKEANRLAVYSYFDVEEYKRPKFEAKFNPITESFKVNDSVKIKGNAIAFAGSNITNAQVVYRVHRKVQYPNWFYRYNPWHRNEAQEITHGKTTTNEKGEFSITFKALPDNSVDKKNLPIFQYEITADVTDINGETRSETTIVNVGYHSLTASISLDSKLDKDSKKHELTINTNNLNGEFVPAKGYIKIYKLKAPDNVLRPRPWSAPDYKTLSKTEFHKLFPNEAYDNESSSEFWDKGKLVFTESFDTEKSKTTKLGNIKKWKSGAYIIELETKDKFGQVVKAESKTTVYSAKDKTLTDKQLFNINTSKTSYQPNDTVELTLASAASNLTVYVEVEKNHNIISKHKVVLNNNKQTLKIPVTKDDLGGFVIHYSYAAFNSFEASSITVNVPYPKTDLDIETTTFRDKLQPGTSETWSFKIKGSKGDQVSAELLASMYDASLDEFKPHQWHFNTNTLPTYYSQYYTNPSNSFRTNNFRVHNPYKRQAISRQEYDQTNWFGLYFYNSQIMIREMTTDMFIEDDAELEEVIITAFGEKKRDELTSAVRVVEIDEMLQGTAPGVNVVGGNGKSGQSAFVKVSGVGSINKSSAPLYIVNGEIRDNILDIEPNSIESIKILKDPKELAVYGEKGVNGVVIITTKDNVSFNNIQVRKNLQETAYFLPQLQTDANGNVSFNFTTPEALTKWKVQLAAHTKTMESSLKTLETVTQKELMVIPNAPRFLREGDQITISTKIANLTDKELSGHVKLELTDALTGNDITNKLINSNTVENSITQNFTVNTKGNTEASWSLNIPFDVQAVQYKVLATTGDFSDGEQSAIPVLSNRMLVTETLPMWIRSNETKTFTLDKLKNTSSTTLKHHNLSLEITSNPSWYAVQALPYLMEYPYECNEQTFSRYYANALASHIANSNPRIQEVFNQWKNSEALISNLEKNQELKSLLIQETPWLRDAQSETEQKKRIALLFDLNKMNNELGTARQKLKRNQNSSGAWSWFNGGRDNRYITQHMITGFGHLKQLGVAIPQEEHTMTINAIRYLDQAFIKEYKDLKKYNKNIDLSKDHLSYTQLHYLYMRSFYKEYRQPKEAIEITEYYHDQIKKYWLKRSLYAKGLMALIVHRMDDSITANKILKSLKENSITSDELGMYWKENSNSWYWYQAPIETQALLIEAFAEIESDITTIDNLKIWLLKNKQTNRWKTTKATTEAVYALLLQGSDWLSVTEMVDVEIGNKKIEPSKLETVKVEAGTGYYKTSWSANEITPELAEVKLTKKGAGIAWGSLYWQYFEDLDKITSSETPLQLKKKLFLKQNTDLGEELSEITSDTPLKVGDLVRVRIELRSDRAMEFVHMKDMRAAGLEPVNVLSKYKWQDGLGYYESTKDAATNFFFDYLPKGVYVFEYDLRVNNSGNMSNGITTIQSMYAPEFSSHSEGVKIKVD